MAGHKNRVRWLGVLWIRTQLFFIGLSLIVGGFIIPIVLPPTIALSPWLIAGGSILWAGAFFGKKGAKSQARKIGKGILKTASTPTLKRGR